MTRFAAGDGLLAAARLDNQQDGNVMRWKQPWLLLCAALAIVALGTTVWDACTNEDTQNGTTATSHAPDHDTQQDPDPDTGPLTLEKFQKLLPSVERMTMEALEHPDRSIRADGVDLSGYPIDVPSKLREGILECLAQRATAVAPRNGRPMNRLVLHLKGGRKIHMDYSGSWYLNDVMPESRLQVEGMELDIAANDDGRWSLSLAWGEAINAALAGHGIAVRRQGLMNLSATLTELALFAVDEKDLALLSRFEQLRKLDCTGISMTLGKEGLRTIAKNCPQLRELVLDYMTFPDELMLPLTDLVHLEKLSLFRVTKFTGTGFHYYSLSARRRDGPTSVDLSFVSSLTDEGMKRICEWDPETLVLTGTNEGLTATGVHELTKTKRLRQVTLGGWHWWQDKNAPTFRALSERKGLKLIY